MKYYYGNVARVLINPIKIGKKLAYRKISTVNFFQIFKNCF